MKTFLKDWSLDGMVNFNELSYLTCYRQSLFHGTTEYKKVRGGINQIIEELEEKAPEYKKLLLELDNQICSLEMNSFDAGYRDGMADLMTSMTLNKATITKGEYVVFEDDCGEGAANA